MAVRDGAHQQDLEEEARRLYEQVARPLEEAHRDEFVAIARDGRYVLGKSPKEVGRHARAQFGPGNFVFKIGPRIVGKWR